jgi:hypothetical protein
VKSSYVVGDKLSYTTPSGRRLSYEVVALNAEPKYRHGHDGPFVEVEREDGERFVVAEDSLDESWWERIAPGPRSVIAERGAEGA